MDTLGYLKTFAQFPLTLRRFLDSPLTLERARRIVRERMEHREENFLRLVEASIYGHPSSPYRAMLEMAGCELGDLRALVQDMGLEGALVALREAGVYVTFKEYKGREPIVRQGREIIATPQDFDNPAARRDFSLQTGGSTGLATAVYQDLDFIAAGAPDHMLMLDAWGVFDAPALHWMAILPSGALRFILQRAHFSRHPERWFSPIGWTDSKYWVQYGSATLYMIAAMRLMGVRVSLPEIVPMDQAGVVARAMREMLDEGRACLLYSSVSRALRVCIAARQGGFDLTGATLRVGGEPITPAKAEAMRQVGARVIPAYGAVDAGSIGIACSRPADTDDVHVCKDAYALIPYPYVLADGASVPALNLTSLLETTSKVMLNYQSDDYAIVERRSCGCPLEALGYSEHLRRIRSYSKLVGEAVTLIADEMVDILERDLPARFGGNALDYQLMEQEDANGFTRLYLIVSPRVEILDEQEVIEFVLQALTETSPMGDGVRRMWQQDQTLQVKRMEPVWTARRKMLPLHIERAEKSS